MWIPDNLEACLWRADQVINQCSSRVGQGETVLLDGCSCSLSQGCQVSIFLGHDFRRASQLAGRDLLANNTVSAISIIRGSVTAIISIAAGETGQATLQELERDRRSRKQRLPV